MPAAPIAIDEERRLNAVRKLKMMGTPAEERFDKITRLAQQLFDVPMAALNIIGEKSSWLKSVQGFDGLEGEPKDTYCTYTVLSEGICLIYDARDDPRVDDSSAVKTWVFYAGTPLHYEGQRIGALCIGDTKPRDFSEEQQAALADLASLAERQLEVTELSDAQLALAASHEELQEKAYIDVLTHFWNYDAIVELLQTELNQAGNQLTLLLLDVDHLKHINNSYGLLAGDEVLRKISEVIRQVIPPAFAVGRLGEDKFLIIITNMSAAGCHAIAKKLCDEVRTTPIVFKKHTLALTCSISELRLENRIEIPDIMEKLTNSMKLAKSRGRNCVEIA